MILASVWKLDQGGEIVSQNEVNTLSDMILVAPPSEGNWGESTNLWFAKLFLFLFYKWQVTGRWHLIGCLHSQTKVKRSRESGMLSLTSSNSVSVQFSHSLQSQSAQGGSKPSLPAEAVSGESRFPSLPPWICAIVFMVTIFSLGGSFDATAPTLERSLSPGRDPLRE